MGTILALILHTHSPRIYKTFQQMVGMELWRKGAAHDLYTILNYLGFSQGVNAARDRVDKVIVNHDQALKEWKSGIEVKHMS